MSWRNSLDECIIWIIDYNKPVGVLKEILASLGFYRG